MNIMKSYSGSTAAFEQARIVIPGGVNSPVRAFRGVGGTPRFFIRGQGAILTDIDGNRYIDYVGSWGPLLVGHAHEAVVDAVCAAVKRGTSFGAPTEAETTLAKRIIEMVPSVEMVRMVNSGTEATMSAIRLARGVTGRDLIIKFEGCYHGHGDPFLIAAGSGVLTLGVPDSPGVTRATARDTLVAKYNDLDSVEALFSEHGGKIAACIVEPVAGNMGVVPPKEGFLQGLREMTSKWGALLVFDEVMSGFRVAAGGAQERYGVMPDITTLGKVIGGGMPVGAYGGRRDIMEHIAPCGPVYQAGTLSGNPVAVAAGLATLGVIAKNGLFYDHLEQKSARLASGLAECCRSLGIEAVINRVGAMMTLFFTHKSAVENYGDATSSDTKMFASFFHALLDEGIYLPPSQYEAIFIGSAHEDGLIDETIEACGRALRKVRAA